VPDPVTEAVADAVPEAVDTPPEAAVVVPVVKLGQVGLKP